MSSRGRGGFFSFLLSNDTVEEREFFQARLRLFAGLVTLMTAGFFLVGTCVAIVRGIARIEQITSELRGSFCLFAIAFAATIWLITGRRAFSARVLDFLDFDCTFTICGCFAVMALGTRVESRPELVVLLATSYTLVARAGVIPSSASRTALIGACSFLPVVITTFIRFRTIDAPAPPDELPPVLHALTWAILGVVVTSAISKVIYGLRRKVDAALKVGQYTLEEKIGAGGMGIVYRASHVLLRRPTAIKLLLAGKTKPHDLVRFEREVQMTSQLTHPNTIAIYDFGHTPDGIFYYAMEYLDGITLEDLVRAHGPQPPARVAHILRQMCGSLHEAHMHGLIHRDIKPANAILGERGGLHDVVKVLDFGLVKKVSTSAAFDPTITTNEVVPGTPLYLAPEAITDPDKVDARADLYALGATAYFLLTAKTVFDGKTVVELCAQHINEKPRPPSQRLKEAAGAGAGAGVASSCAALIPEKLDRLVLSLLEKNPERRPRTAAIVAEALDACEAGAWTDDKARRYIEETASKEHAHGKDRKRLGSLSDGSLSDAERSLNVSLEGRMGAVDVVGGRGDTSLGRTRREGTRASAVMDEE